MSLEALFALGAITEKPEYVQSLIATHEADKRTVADRMLRWQDPGLQQEVAKRISKVELEALKASKAKSMNTFDLAAAADMEDWYLSLYSLLSFPAHGALSDLARHIEIAADGTIEGLKNEPEFDDQEAPWSYAIEIQIKAVEKVAAVFNREPIELQAHRDALHTLINRAEA
jgi:hypothetical protein